MVPERQNISREDRRSEGVWDLLVITGTYRKKEPEPTLAWSWEI